MKIVTWLLSTAVAAFLLGPGTAQPPSKPEPLRRELLTDGERKKDSLRVNDRTIDLLRGTRCKEYEIRCEAGKTYVIDMEARSKDFDPYLRLKDEYGKQWASDDDGGEGWNARIVFSCTRTGRYIVIATSYADDVGEYEIAVRHPEGPIRKPVTRDVGFAKENLDSAIPGAAFKSFPVLMEGGRRYRVELTRMAGALKPTLIVKNPRGLAHRGEADDNDPGTERVGFDCPETETYIVVAGFSGANDPGSFRLSIIPVK